jgi:hypothetical protein
MSAARVEGAVLNGPTRPAMRWDGGSSAKIQQKYEIGDCFFREYPQNINVFVWWCT